MKNLITAIFAKITSSTSLFIDVGGRVFLDNAKDAQFPYVVVSIVGGSNQDNFTDVVDDVLVQFDLFSTLEGVTEIGTMYADLKALFDNADLSITSNACLKCQRQGPPITSVEPIVSKDGDILKQWSVDYEITLEAT